MLVENFRPRHDGTLRPGLRAVAQRQSAARLRQRHGLRRGPGAALPGYDFLMQAVGGLMSDHRRARRRSPPRSASRSWTCSPASTLTAGDPGRAVRPRAHRAGPAGRGEPARQPARRAGQPGLGLAQRRRGAAAGWATRTRASRPTRRCGPPTARSRSRWATTASVQRLTQALGAARGGRFTTNAGRVAHREALAAQLEAVTVHRDTAHWIEVLGAAGVPCGPVNTVAEGIALAERLGLAPVVEVDGARSVASPIRLSETPVTYRLPPP